MSRWTVRGKPHLWLHNGWWHCETRHGYYRNHTEGITPLEAYIIWNYMRR